MRRKLFSLCWVLSLLMCAAVCVLWLRGYLVADQWIISYERPVESIVSDRQLRMHSGHGGCEFSYVHLRMTEVDSFVRGDGLDLSHFRYNVVSAGSATEQFGFSARS